MMGGGSSPTPPTPTQYTIVVYPSSYDEDNSVFLSSSYIENGYTSADSNTQAQFNLITGTDAESYVYYKFDLSQIPANATIDSITAEAKANVSTTLGNRIAQRYLQICDGTTPVGTQSEALSTTATKYVLDTGSGWTGANIGNIAVKLFAKRGTDGPNDSRNMKFYGATLTITYTA